MRPYSCNLIRRKDHSNIKHTISEWIKISLFMSTVEQIKVAYETFVAENEKFVTKGNKAAAGRARKALSEMAKLAKVRRAEILAEKK